MRRVRQDLSIIHDNFREELCQPVRGSQKNSSGYCSLRVKIATAKLNMLEIQCTVYYCCMYFNTEGDRFTKKLIHGEILHIKIQLLKSVLNGLVTDEALQVTMPFILKLDPVILETVDT
jgi:hypothetical protein